MKGFGLMGLEGLESLAGLESSLPEKKSPADKQSNYRPGTIGCPVHKVKLPARYKKPLNILCGNAPQNSGNRNFNKPVGFVIPVDGCFFKWQAKPKYDTAKQPCMHHFIKMGNVKPAGFFRHIFTRQAYQCQHK